MIRNPGLNSTDGCGIMRDVDGNELHAHGGQIIKDGGLYYLVGTTRKEPPSWLSEGINMYSSTDLQHWKLENMIFRNSSITIATGPYRIERPKVLYNAKTSLYVMWFHLDNAAFDYKMVGVATSKTIDGDYQFYSGFQPDGQASFDMGLFQEDDGTAWLVRSVDNKAAGFSKLTDDYLNTTRDGIISSAPSCEGQAAWRTGDHYFLICSHLTGWSANGLLFFQTNAPLGSSKWNILDDPSDGSKTVVTK